MQVRKVLKSEQGYVTVIFLILIPLTLLLLITVLDQSRAVFGTDLDMQQALNDACRSATLMVDPLSQAYNDPMLDPDKAHKAFTDILASNLKLNDDLSSRDSSPVKNVEYIFFVINNDNPYDLPNRVIYSSNNPLGEVIDDSASPEIFVPWVDTALFINNNAFIGNSEWMNLDPINDADIIQGINDSVIRVELEDVGCVGIAKADLKPILGKQESTGVRWSAARLLREEPESEKPEEQ